MSEHHAHASADDQYLETPPGAEYEHTDAHVWVIVKFLIWLAISAVLIHFGLGLMYGFLIEQSKETDRQYPLAAPSTERRLPPPPRLQQFPANELYEFRLGEEQFLHQYGWMNRDAGIVHMPVEDAMRILVQRGLPSDSSSGRVMERRRQ